MVHFIELRVDNTPLEITLSLLTPYIILFLAESVEASGVLATVAAGLYLARYRSSILSARTSIKGGSFRNTFTFLLNGIVFLLIRLKLPVVLQGIRSMSPAELAISAAELAASVIALRLLWVLPAAYLGYLVRRRLLHQPEEPPKRIEELRENDQPEFDVSTMPSRGFTSTV